MFTLGSALVNWYHKNRRVLPWRASRDPYRIWISEVMLQQTTVKAVIPFYERFLERFPNVKTLANAKIEDVYEYWAGLGYYSRARNLHKSAQILAKTGFPKTHTELLELPGFGPYTARAVAALSADEAVGVLDGNVIRILSRVFALKSEWWNNSERNKLQTIADEFVIQNVQKGLESNSLNQAMMELGATLCTPQKPLCISCPWMKNCESHKKDLVSKLPLPKPRKQHENWIWKAQIVLKKNKIALVQNDYAPFLKGTWIFPGQVSQVKTRPQDYDLKHSITHHNIYIKHAKSDKLSEQTAKKFDGKIKWVTQSELPQINPASLLQKTLNKALKDS